MESRDLSICSSLHKAGHTSKGDQRKWKIEEFWYKADYTGYEGLSEVLISRLLEKSSLPYAFVPYEPVQIVYGEDKLRGCRSRDFLQEGQILIPLEKLYRKYTGESLARMLSQEEDVSARIRYLVEQTEEITHIENFGAYITTMLEMDAFFLNEDRHTNNMAVIYDEAEKKYTVSPFFDQGLSLFADLTQDYPLQTSLEKCLEKIEAKPFSTDFDTQLDAAEELYGVQLRFHFTVEDVRRELEQLASMYPREICSRVEQVMRMQIRKYGYLMEPTSML